MCGLEAFFTSRKNINTLFASPGGFIWRNILDQFFLRHFPFDKLTNDWRSRWAALVPKNPPPPIPYTNWICMSELTCAEGHRLRVDSHFFSGIAERAKRQRAWKSPHARKGDTCRHVLISAACNFKNNAQETYLYVSYLWRCHLHVISLLTLSSIAIRGD